MLRFPEGSLKVIIGNFVKLVPAEDCSTTCILFLIDAVIELPFSVDHTVSAGTHRINHHIYGYSFNLDFRGKNTLPSGSIRPALWDHAQICERDDYPHNTRSIVAVMRPSDVVSDG